MTSFPKWDWPLFLAILLSKLELRCTELLLLEANRLAFSDWFIHSPATSFCIGLMVPSFIIKSETTSKILVSCISRKWVKKKKEEKKKIWLEIAQTNILLLPTVSLRKVSASKNLTQPYSIYRLLAFFLWSTILHTISWDCNLEDMLIFSEFPWTLFLLRLLDLWQNSSKHLGYVFYPLKKKKRMVLNLQNNICSFKIPLHIILFLRFLFFFPPFPYKVLPDYL